MSRIDVAVHRYSAVASLMRHGVDVISVGDPSGAQLNAAARELMLVARDDDPGLWDSLMRPVKALRWRLLTHPQPLTLNPAVREAAEEVILQARALRHAVADSDLLERLASSARAVTESDPAPGDALQRLIQEIGADGCVLVAASRQAQAAMAAWTGRQGVAVLTPGELGREEGGAQHAVVVGPPRFFGASLVTAPASGSMHFVVPSWFRDLSLPRSPIAAYAEGAVQIRVHIRPQGDTTEPALPAPDTDLENELLPQPSWPSPSPPNREPTSDEVVAHKVLLSGGLAMWLDDGERIRALDPAHPSGERVTFIDVGTVRPGTYLLLRKGESDRDALHAATLRELGARGPAIDETQGHWKQRLTDRILRLGYPAVVRELTRIGVRSADRARAWTAPNLIRPQRDADLKILLEWLDVPAEPSFENANLFRQALYRASADIRERLEKAIDAADLSELDRVGHLALDVQAKGFRGILATRVLAISPNVSIVARRDARVPFDDRSAQWLE
jgi:hypothetical protein